MHKRFLIIAALLGALSVALGAFAAHGLKKIVPPESVATFETGVRYQFYHVFALLATGMLFQNFPNKWLKLAGNTFIVGIVLFCGSLYILTALAATHSVGLKGIGLVTPFGGLFFIVGWICLLIGIVSHKNASNLRSN